jgi:glycosyltransferase involved in cell wall biosynthesis
MPGDQIRALVVSNMRADGAAPGRGSFVRDQVQALAARPGVEVELFELGPGPRALAAAALGLHRRFGRERFDVVHAHFGLTQWPALAARARARVVTLHGTDLRHPRTRMLTAAALGRMDLVACASSALAQALPAHPRARRLAVLPCGVSMERFVPIARSDARARLGLDPEGPYLLFPAAPGRAIKRHDRALAAAGDVRLLTAGAIAPQEMPLWINAANAVLVPSDSEGFGLAVLEALACEVPVLATPVGIHPVVLRGLPGTLCAPFDAAAWRAALEPHVRSADPRVDGRPRAELFSAPRMAARVELAWRSLLQALEARAGRRIADPGPLA